MAFVAYLLNILLNVAVGYISMNELIIFNSTLAFVEKVMMNKIKLLSKAIQ